MPQGPPAVLARPATRSVDGSRRSRVLSPYNDTHSASPACSTPQGEVPTCARDPLPADGEGVAAGPAPGAPPPHAVAVTMTRATKELRTTRRANTVVITRLYFGLELHLKHGRVTIG